MLRTRRIVDPERSDLLQRADRCGIEVPPGISTRMMRRVIEAEESNIPEQVKGTVVERKNSSIRVTLEDKDLLCYYETASCTMPITKARSLMKELKEVKPYTGSKNGLNFWYRKSFYRKRFHNERKVDTFKDNRPSIIIRCIDQKKEYKQTKEYLKMMGWRQHGKIKKGTYTTHYAPSHIYTHANLTHTYIRLCKNGIIHIYTQHTHTTYHDRKHAITLIAQMTYQTNSKS